MNQEKQTIKGKNWNALKIDNQYIISIHNQAPIVESLTDFVRTQDITAGNISGIGAVKSATLKFFNHSSKQFEQKTFDEQMEMSNLSGNIYKLEDKNYIHVHATFGKQDYSAIAGHLEESVVNGACEIHVIVLDTILSKKKDEQLQINLYDFDSL